MSGGFGGGGWGAVPWGGSALEFENPPVDFDVFCFFDSLTSMGGILIDPSVSTIDAGGQFSIDVNFDLLAKSGGALPTADAFLSVSVGVPPSWTLEFTMWVDQIPADFTDLVNRHIFIGTTNTTGPCAGFFISALGVMYAGGVHLDGLGNLQVDSTTQVIPGSNAYVGTGRYIVFRIAVDATSGTVYLYVTDLANLPLTGHVLRAVLPTIDAGTLATPPIDQTVVTVRGTVLQPTAIRLDELCMSSSVLIPNLAPVADAGIDKSVQFCEVIQLDGSNSFDPEGANLLYRWELIDAPQTSMYVVAESDGHTLPIDLTGFTNKFYSATLGLLLDPVQVGDVLLFDGEPRSISAVGTDINGYFLQFAVQNIPDSLSLVAFRVLRQRGIYHADTVAPTFLPDVVGFYKFELIVSDGQLPSAPAIVVFNILESLLPRGVVPDVSFLFGLMSDFWSLVEDRDRITTLWSGVAQVASGELLTLWQHDYAKSLRDIQRQFTRKWLHYDMLLPEPIPELTKVRVLWGGLYSTSMQDSWWLGGYAVNGRSLTLSSPIWTAPKTIVFGAIGPFTQPTDFAVALDSLLKSLDQRFRVECFVVSGADYTVIRIYAPFAFQVDSSTLDPVKDYDASVSLPLFPNGSRNAISNGTVNTNSQLTTRAGGAVGANTYRVFADITTLGLAENDFLCVDGVAYQISKLTAGSSGTALWTDVVVKETLPSSPSKTWAIASYVSSELLDFWNGLVARGDQAFLEIAESTDDIPTTAMRYELFRTRVIGISETAPTRLPIDQGYLPVDPADTAATVRLARVLRRQYVPISSLVLDVPTLSAKIVVETQTDEEAVLRRNVDFTLEDVRGGSAIKFVAGVDDPTLDVWEAQDPPNRLWAEFTYLDNRPIIEQNFGIPVEFTLDDLAQLTIELDYLSAVRGLWYAYFNGPTLSNLRIGAQILLGLPFAEEAGTIEEIRTDFSPTLGRILLRDTANAAIVRSYTYPRVLALETNPTTSKVYAVGDSVQQFAPLVKGADIVDYVKNPRWFEGILNQGVFREIEKYFRFLVQVDSAAFNLAAVLAVRNFVLKIKPTYTYPMIVVQSGAADRVDDITVDDTVTEHVTLHMTDSTCGARFGSGTIFDDYRGNGLIANQFDTSINPSDPPPTFPTSDSPVLWAFDKDWLCPEDSLVAELSTRFAAPGPILVGQCFLVGAGYDEVHKFLLLGASTVPASPATLPVPADPVDPTAGVVALTGQITKIKLRTRAGESPYTIHGTGSITVVAGAQLVDGDSFFFSASPGINFEFDSDGVVTPGNVRIPFTPADTVSQVRDAVIKAILDARRRALASSTIKYWVPNVIPSIGGPAVVALVADQVVNVAGIDNTGITESVADPGFTVTPVTGSEHGGAYVVFIKKNGTSITGGTGISMLITDPNGSVEFVLPSPVAVTAADTITAEIRTQSSVSSRVLQMIEITVYQTGAASWLVGQTLPAGTYRTIRELSP